MSRTKASSSWRMAYDAKQMMRSQTAPGWLGNFTRPHLENNTQPLLALLQNLDHVVVRKHLRG